MPLTYRLIRPLMTFADRVRRRYRRIRGKRIYGVMMLAHTPHGGLVLIRQTYAPSWCLPGGGRSQDEEPVAAALRELREEIGLLRWTEARKLLTLEYPISGVPARIDLVRVDGVEFAFKPNLEVELARVFDPAALPDDINRWSARFLAAAADLAVVNGD